MCALGVNLEESARTGVVKARTSLRTLLGEAITLRPNENGEHLEAVLADGRQQLLAVAAKSLRLKDRILLVAGEGFEPSTFGL